MHVFHEYISKQLHDHLKRRRIVVWYDPNNEFVPYIEGLLANTPAPDTSAEISSVLPTTHCSLSTGLAIHLVRFAGSFFEVRATVESLVAVDQPGPLLIYLPGVDRDRTGSILMEREKAGSCYEPQLKRLARNVLRESYTDGIIDEMLAPENVTYADIVGFLAQNAGGEQASMLKVIFAGCPDSTVLLATWLADDTQDTAILSKEATAELFKLIDTRLGLELRQGTPLSGARAKTVRYVLVNEFRSDLRCDPPISVNMIPPVPSKDHLHRTREVVAKLRQGTAGGLHDAG